MPNVDACVRYAEQGLCDNVRINAKNIYMIYWR